jgi:signal transduction histidine kinase
MNKKTLAIRTKVLVPLGIVMLFLISALIFTEYKVEFRNLDEQYQNYFVSAERLFTSEIDKEAVLIAGLANILSNQPELQNTFQNRDRDGLLAAALPDLNDLSSHYSVTHLYFHDLDKTCFLRIHKPSKYGDSVKRHMLDEAIESGQYHYGMELGRFGTYTLRLVYPWRVDDKVIGYLELGKEIQRITPSLKSILNVDVALLINKRFVTRDGWEQGLQMMERAGDWNQFSDFVMIDQTRSDLMTEFVQHGVSEYSDESDIDAIRYHRTGKRTSVSGSFELEDAIGNKVGTLFILKDATVESAHIYQLAAIYGASSLCAAVLILGLFYVYLGRIQRRLEKADKKQRIELMHRRFAEAQMTEAKDRAEASNRAKSQFMANMSHELRTPMNAVLGFSELLKDEELTTDQIDYVDTIYLSSRHLLTLINDVLDISKIEAGKEEIALGVCSLRDMLGQLEHLMLTNAQTKGIHFELDIRPDVPEQVVTDAKHLYQCLINLVSNAIKFTEQGSVILHVGLADHEVGPLLYFEVADTGIGVPEDRQEKVFESFEQADSSTSRKYGGTGLGLAITRELIKMMGGAVSLESQESVGSIFTITLPVELVSPAAVSSQS